jgi:aspartate kinase
MEGVTDELIELTDLYVFGHEEAFRRGVADFGVRHLETLREMQLPERVELDAEEGMQRLLDAFAVYANELSGPLQPDQYDCIVSYGERLSSYLLSRALLAVDVPSHMVFGSDVLVTDRMFGNARVIHEYSSEKTRAILDPLVRRGIVPVVTGFFGGTRDGRIAILGRGGSDYTAAALASFLDADKLTLWKNVDGVFTSDPVRDPHAVLLPKLSYAAATEIAMGGARVLHAGTIDPVRSKMIPIEVRNTFHPEHEGTKIHG